jgi:hypothetical protein
LQLVSFSSGFVYAVYTINNYRRQSNVQIVMAYTPRYERILDQFPQEALAARFDSKRSLQKVLN